MVYGVSCIVYSVLYAVFSSSWLNIWHELFILLIHTVMVYYWRLDKENSRQRQIIIRKKYKILTLLPPVFPPFQSRGLYGREEGKATFSCATINHIVEQYAVSFYQGNTAFKHHL